MINYGANTTTKANQRLTLTILKVKCHIYLMGGRSEYGEHFSTLVIGISWHRVLLQTASS